MIVYFSDVALGDLNEIGDYVAVRDPAAAQRVLSDILSCAESLPSSPDLGRTQLQPGVRRVISPRYRYLIYYRVKVEEIEVITVQHGRRDRLFQDT